MQEVYMGKLHYIVGGICLVERVFPLQARATHAPFIVPLLYSIVPVDMWVPKPKEDPNENKKVTNHSFEKYD